MSLNNYKKEILKSQYEELLSKGKQAKSNENYQTAAKSYSKAADRLSKLDEEERSEDYSEQINKLERVAEELKSGNDPTDTSTESDQSDRNGDRGAQSGEDDEDYQQRIESFITETNVTWEDIGGLEEVQDRIKRAIALGAVSNKPEAVSATDRVLMFGPPGTGKTLLASAVAGSMDATFFDVKLGGLLSKYFGDSSKLITALFGLAANMSPSVIFLDEIDALTQSRDSNSDSSSRRVLNTLLSELDGIDKGADNFVMVVGATNQPGDLDNAVRRRFPERLLIPLPDERAAEEIVQIHTIEGDVAFANRHPKKFVPQDSTVSPADSVTRTIARECVARGYTGSDIQALCRGAIDDMVRRSNPDLVSVADAGFERLSSFDLTVNPISPSDVHTAFETTSASLSQAEIEQYEEWDEQYGTSNSK